MNILMLDYKDRPRDKNTTGDWDYPQELRDCPHNIKMIMIYMLAGNKNKAEVLLNCIVMQKIAWGILGPPGTPWPFMNGDGNFHCNPNPWKMDGVPYA